MVIVQRQFLLWLRYRSLSSNTGVLQRCTGNGISESDPLTLFQMISFSANIGVLSTSEKSIFWDSFAPYARLAFFTLRSTCGFRCWNGLRSVCVPNDLYIGVAAASYWLMGGRPSSSSIVRSIELVV